MTDTSLNDILITDISFNDVNNFSKLLEGGCEAIMARTNTLNTGELTDTMYYILLNLMEPSHGYMIMQNVEELTQGTFVIGAGSLYTTLKKLLDAELIQMIKDQEGNKKTYVITDKGLRMVKDEVDRKKEMVEHAENILRERERLK